MIKTTIVYDAKKIIPSLPFLVINKESEQIILVTKEESSYFVGTVVSQGNQQLFPVGYHSSYWLKENLEPFYGTISLSNNLEIQKHNYKNCGFKVGDKVKVLRKAENGENGWNNIWVPIMDKYIGKTCVVVDNKNENGFGLILQDDSLRDDIRFSFPHFVLEKVSSDADTSINTTPTKAIE